MRIIARVDGENHQRFDAGSVSRAVSDLAIGSDEFAEPLRLDLQGDLDGRLRVFHLAVVACGPIQEAPVWEPNPTVLVSVRERRRSHRHSKAMFFSC